MLMRTRKPVRKIKKLSRSERGIIYGKKVTGDVTTIHIENDRTHYKDVIFFEPSEKDDTKLNLKSLTDLEFRKGYMVKNLETIGNILCINVIIYDFLKERPKDESTIRFLYNNHDKTYEVSYLMKRLNYTIQLLMDKLNKRLPDEKRAINVKTEVAYIIIKSFLDTII